MQLSVLNGPMASLRGQHCEVSQKDSTSIDSPASQGQRHPNQLLCVATVTTATLLSWKQPCFCLKAKRFRRCYLIRSSLDVEAALEHLLWVMAKGNNYSDAFKYVCPEKARAFKNIIVDVPFGHLM